MKEIWKNIPNYEGMYQVSNLGRVKSFMRSTKFGCADELILKGSLANNGYCQVTLYNGKSKKKFLVHRLVAISFLPNPNCYPQVNHIDENPENNNVTNLEWCTAKYNNDYGTAKMRRFETEQKKRKPVAQLLPNGTVIAKYQSAKVASMLLGKKLHLITTCCNGKCASAEGYCWKYISEAEFGG